MSKFDQLCNLIIERTESSLNESRDNTYYGLNPDFDSSSLTGFDQVVANFLEVNPATAEEIVDVIQRNSEEPDNRAAAVDVFRNLIDTQLLTPTTAPDAAPDSTEVEPDANALAQEPEVDVNEPVAVPSTEEEEEDEDQKSTTAGAVPPPEEDEADTFSTSETPKSKIEDISPANSEDELDKDELDDTPTSELINKSNKKAKQMEKLVRYLYNKRGKSSAEADEQIKRLRAEGKI